jgi:hypothetical protein
VYKIMLGMHFKGISLACMHVLYLHILLEFSIPLSEPMPVKTNILSDVTNFFFAFLLAQPADFFRDDNPEGIEARNEVSTPY